MVKAIIFDLDGTLIDSTEAIVESFFHTFDALGEARPERQAVVDGIGHLLEDQFAGLTARDPGECVRVYRKHYVTVMKAKTHLLPGAAECLRRFRESGLRLGFATSKRREYAEQILDHLGVLNQFEVRLGPDDIAHPKPHPEVVHKALDALRLKAGEAVFAGDTHFDVLAAKNAGVRCVCVTTGYATREALEALGPEAVFDDLAALTDYVLNGR